MRNKAICFTTQISVEFLIECILINAPEFATRQTSDPTRSDPTGISSASVGFGMARTIGGFRICSGISGVSGARPLPIKNVTTIRYPPSHPSRVTRQKSDAGRLNRSSVEVGALADERRFRKIALEHCYTLMIN